MFYQNCFFFLHTFVFVENVKYINLSNNYFLYHYFQYVTRKFYWIRGNKKPTGHIPFYINSNCQWNGTLVTTRRINSQISGIPVRKAPSWINIRIDGVFTIRFNSVPTSVRMEDILWGQRYAYNRQIIFKPHHTMFANSWFEKDILK